MTFEYEVLRLGIQSSARKPALTDTDETFVQNLKSNDSLLKENAYQIETS